jgi:hypothetical protein
MKDEESNLTTASFSSLIHPSSFPLARQLLF